MKIILPSHFSLLEKIGKDYVYQLSFDKSEIEGSIKEFSFNRVHGYLITGNGGREILISSKKNWSAHARFDQIVFAKDFENINEGDLSKEKYKWIKHPAFGGANTCQEIIN